jgi:hypothetical protein
MPNVVHIQTNFTAGEISPRLFGRVDLAKYNHGAKTIENAVIQTHGGASRRPGTRFASEVKTGAYGAPRLIEFHFNATDSYVLEIGSTHATDENAGYMRPYYQNSSGLPVRILASDDSDIEKTGLGWSYLDLPYLKFTQSADTMYIFNGGNTTSDKGNPILRLRRVGADDTNAGWQIEALQSTTDNTFHDGPYLGLNTPVSVLDTSGDPNVTADIHLKCTDALVEIGSDQDVSAYTDETAATAIYPFRATDKGRLIRLEGSDRGYNVTYFKPGMTADAQNYAIVRVAEEAFSTAIQDGGGTNAAVEFFDVTRGPTFLDETLHQARGVSYETGTGTTIHLYHADTGQPEPYNYTLEAAGDEIVGKVKLKATTHVGWGIITAVSNEQGSSSGFYQTVTVKVKKKFIDKDPTKNWRLGAWSDTTGHPSCGTFHQGRLYIANTKTQPQTIWASETNVFDTYSPTDPTTSLVVDSQAMTITLASDKVNAVNHMRSDSQGLLVFTEGGEWLGRASQPSAPITPTDVSFTKQSTFGSLSTVPAVRLGTSYLVFQRDGVVLREFSYEFASDRFNAPNLTLLSEHITRNRVKESTIQLGSSQRLWCVTQTGELLSLCYDQAQQVTAWSRHILAESGTGGSANTVATVESIARTTDTNEDNIWLLVKRTIGTTEKYFVEMMVNEFESVDDHKNAFYVESGLTGEDTTSNEGAGTSDWTGLAHLNGESVYVLGDSVQYGPFVVNAVVTDGIRITSGASSVNCNNVSVGLKYKTIIETVPLNIAQGLEPRAKKKRIFSAFVNMYRSISGQMGTTDQLYNIEYSAPTSTPPELKTEMAELSFPDNSEREMIIRFEQDDVHPSNLLSITSEIHLGV